MSRNGVVGIVDASGRDKAHHPVVYGATLRVCAGQTMRVGEIRLDCVPLAGAMIV